MITTHGRINLTLLMATVVVTLGVGLFEVSGGSLPWTKTEVFAVELHSVRTQALAPQEQRVEVTLAIPNNCVRVRSEYKSYDGFAHSIRLVPVQLRENCAHEDRRQVIATYLQDLAYGKHRVQIQLDRGTQHLLFIHVVPRPQFEEPGVQLGSL